MRALPSLKFSRSIFTNPDLIFYPNMFYDIDSEIAFRAATLLFAKMLKIKNSEQAKMDAFVDEIDLRTQLIKLAMGLSIDGGYLYYFETGIDGLPLLKYSKYYYEIPNGVVVLEKIPYATTYVSGYLTIKKTITPKTTKLEFFNNDYSENISFVETEPTTDPLKAISLEAFNELSKAVKFKNSSYPTPYGLWYETIFNRPADTFELASDVAMSTSLNVAAQRELYFAVADTEKSQSRTYLVSRYAQNVTYDPWTNRVSVRNNKVLADQVEVLSTDSNEDGKVILDPANPKGISYLDQFERYEKRIWQNAGYTYMGSEGAIVESTATGISALSKQDTNTTELKKALLDNSLKPLLGKWFRLWKGIVDDEVDEIEINIQPNYQLDEEKLFELNNNKFKAGVIDLKEFVMNVKQVDEDAARKYLDDSENWDFMNGRIELAKKLDDAGIFDKQALSTYLIGSRTGLNLEEEPTPVIDKFDVDNFDNGDSE